MPTISATVLTACSALLAYIASYLKSDKLSGGINMVIGGLATFIIGAACAWLTGFTGDIQQNVLMVLTCWVLFIHQLITLLQSAQQAPSPILTTRQQDVIAPPVVPVVASPSIPANALIHIEQVGAVHVNTPISTPSPEQATLPGDIVTDKAVSATGILTKEEASEKTLKMQALPKALVTTPLAG